MVLINLNDKSKDLFVALDIVTNSKDIRICENQTDIISRKINSN